MPKPETMKGFAELMTVSDALRRLFEVLPTPRPEIEQSDLLGALQRVLAEEVVCPFDVPQFDRSTVDGYALKAVDSVGASPTNPLEFRVVATIPAGSRPDETREVKRGESALISTGAPMPAGTDAVVMVEQCSRVGDRVEVRRQVHPMQNVSRRGEDYTRNETVVSAGTILKPWHIAAAASIGVTTLKVRRNLLVGVVSTGSEVVEPGKALAPGQVANSTKPLLLALAKQRGCQLVDLGTVPDDAKEIAKAITLGLQKCDLILTTGGSSVGERDLVQDAITSIRQSAMVAHGLRIRPGRPTGISVINGKPIFVLSGFPVAAMAGFQALVEPTIAYLMGSADDLVPLIKGTLTRRVSNESGNREYVRVRVTRTAKGIEVNPLMLTGSGLLSSLTKANGMLVIDEAVEGYDQGEEVEVLLTGKVFQRKSTSEESEGFMKRSQRGGSTTRSARTSERVSG